MKLRDIPSVNALLAGLPWEEIPLPRQVVADIVRSRLDGVRKGARNGQVAVTKEEIVQTVRQAVLKASGPSLRKVINGTGIVLHTGLGRAPFSKSLLRRVEKEMGGYSSLEIDLEDGKRGERTQHVSQVLNSLTGAGDSLVVNNNAAAVLLALNTLADGKEVIISRGQLVEIGGSFRIPEVIAKSGARLVEVGTTNRTYLKDYVGALSGNTGSVLVVHTSNFRIEGFTREVPVDALAEVCRKKGIPLITDLGSGALFDLEKIDFPYEPVVSDVLNRGANLVTFSGDKLLGGPQAGLICGDRTLISALHFNPLYRALRCDKLTLSLLEHTLKSYRNIPPGKENATYHLFSVSRKTLMRRGQKLVDGLKKSTVKKLGIKVVPTEVEAGSGSLPTEKLESAALQFDAAGFRASNLATSFRMQDTPIVGYVSDHHFYVDLKTVLPEQLQKVAEATERVAIVLGSS